VNFTINNAEQRSPEWFAARCGRLTGSQAGDMLATVKSKGEAAGRRNLRAKLVVERLTGEPQEDGFDSEWMRRGRELEPRAFDEYEAATGNVVRRTGFLSHTELPVGCSLDGDVDTSPASSRSSVRRPERTSSTSRARGSRRTIGRKCCITSG
jgi:hypothetical protein